MHIKCTYEYIHDFMRPVAIATSNVKSMTRVNLWLHLVSEIQTQQGELLTWFQLVLTSSAKLGTGTTHKVSVSVMWLWPCVPAHENNLFTC